MRIVVAFDIASIGTEYSHGACPNDFSQAEKPCGLQHMNEPPIHHLRSAIRIACGGIDQHRSEMDDMRNLVFLDGPTQCRKIANIPSYAFHLCQFLFRQHTADRVIDRAHIEAYRWNPLAQQRFQNMGSDKSSASGD